MESAGSVPVQERARERERENDVERNCTKSLFCLDF